MGIVPQGASRSKEKVTIDGIKRMPGQSTNPGMFGQLSEGTNS